MNTETTTCRWCRRGMATQRDHDTLPEGEDGGLCWREWNPHSDCHELQHDLQELAPDLLTALHAVMQCWCPDICRAEEKKVAMFARETLEKAKGEYFL